jgi:hypothetical protein
MNFRSLLLSLVLLVLLGSANLDPYPDNYFRSPLGIPLYLSGGFAEMRSNHFHGGLDIKTQGQTGFRVYSAADGWISRIVISASGYGNALYISHPNGHMTVYGHLDRFRDDIQEYMKGLQYEKESFEVQYFPNRDQFLVLKGEEIALSGNTGGSGGPHLHFEIRDETTGAPVNPLLWGLDVKDLTSPRIFRIKVYALGENSTVRLRDKKTGGWRKIETGETVTIDATLKNGRHVFDRVDQIEAAGSIGFSVQSQDYHDGSTNRLGLYTIRLEDSGSTLFRSAMDQISFDDTRYINAHVDYAERLKSGRWFERSYILPGNKLPIYESTRSGILTVLSGEKHDLKYEVTDAHGNQASLAFSVLGIEQTANIVKASARGETDFDLPFDQSFSFRAEGFSLNIPKGALYTADRLIYRSEKGTANNIHSDIHVVHKREVPIHSWVTIEIVPTPLPENLKSKAGIVRVGAKGNISWVGGAYDQGVVRARIRNFDRFAVGIDNQNPTIRPINLVANKDLSRTSQIRVRIGDALSGIKTYSGHVDGDWVLFEYDAKTATITHRFDEKTASGSHVLKLSVTDNKDNTETLTIPFVR